MKIDEKFRKSLLNNLKTLQFDGWDTTFCSSVDYPQCDSNRDSIICLDDVIQYSLHFGSKTQYYVGIDGYSTVDFYIADKENKHFKWFDSIEISDSETRTSYMMRVASYIGYLLGVTV